MGSNNHQKNVKKQEVKPEQKAAEPEIQEIQEFVVSSEQDRSERKKAEQASINAFAGLSGAQKSAAALILFLAAAIAFIMTGIRVCAMDAALVCTLLVLQTAISALLAHNPVWLHICVAAADLILGFCFNQVILMAVSMVVYVAAVVALEILQRADRQKKAQK